MSDSAHASSVESAGNGSCSPSPAGDCRVNSLSIESLFELYARSGFLYPAKMQKLAPYLPLIRENWRKAVSCGDGALMVITHHNEHGEADSSITTWRSTGQGWVSQHLVSSSPDPFSTRAVLLYAQALKIARGTDDSQQNWFRPENRFPARVFGSVVATLGPSLASVIPHAYLSLRRDLAFGHSVLRPRTVDYDESQAEAFRTLVEQAEGSVFFDAEDLSKDPTLAAAGDVYGKLGLHRSRTVRLAYVANRSEPVAAVLAYRGPLGMNFSFLENRCQLIANPACDQETITAAFASLLDSVRPAYANFELDAIPVVVSAAQNAVAQSIGLDFIRNYTQSVWLREGFQAWYRHVDNFYTRLLSRAQRKAASEHI